MSKTTEQTETVKPSVPKVTEKSVPVKRKQPPLSFAAKKQKLDTTVKSLAEDRNLKRQYLCVDVAYTPIVVNIKGIFDIAAIVYSQLTRHDPKLQQMLTLFQFQYVCYAAAFIKLILCDSYRGRALDVQIALLQSKFKLLRFPLAIADFIDALGTVTTPNGIPIIPTLGPIYQSDGRNVTHVEEANNLNPFPYMLANHDAWLAWNAQNRPLSIEYGGSATQTGYFSIDAEILASYVAAQPRLEKCGTMRAPRSEMVGTLSQLVSVRSISPGKVPMAPCVMDEADARKGLAFKFHDYEEFEKWQAANRSVLWPLCSGTIEDSHDVLLAMAVSSVRH